MIGSIADAGLLAKLGEARHHFLPMTNDTGHADNTSKHLKQAAALFHMVNS